MALDHTLNTILKEMWRLDEKKNNGYSLDSDEDEFWEKHITTIKEYYTTQHNYWNNRH